MRRAPAASCWCAPMRTRPAARSRRTCSTVPPSYDANPAAFDGSVFINTPLTADAQGNVFFGFHVTGTNPAGLMSGIARVAPDGTGTWVGAAAAAGDPAIQKPAMNCAPALSLDGSTVYIAVNVNLARGRHAAGHAARARQHTTLATRAAVALTDPNLGTPARISDDGTAAPVIGPDGRVFYGVLEAHVPDPQRARLAAAVRCAAQSGGGAGQLRVGRVAERDPGVDGAAPTPGASTYLLAQKYNNYRRRRHRRRAQPARGARPEGEPGRPGRAGRAGHARGDDDPRADPATAITTTRGASGASTRWPPIRLRGSILANNEDGMLYRWDLATNTLSQNVQLTTGLGQAYTPTLVAPTARSMRSATRRCIRSARVRALPSPDLRDG